MKEDLLQAYVTYVKSYRSKESTSIKEARTLAHPRSFCLGLRVPRALCALLPRSPSLNSAPQWRPTGHMANSIWLCVICCSWMLSRPHLSKPRLAMSKAKQNKIPLLLNQPTSLKILLKGFLEANNSTNPNQPTKSEQIESNPTNRKPNWAPGHLGTSPALAASGATPNGARRPAWGEAAIRNCQKSAYWGGKPEMGWNWGEYTKYT